MVVKKKSKGKVITVDFSGVTTSGAVPEDNYAVRVEDVTQEEGPKAPYLNFELKITEGKYKGKKLWHICTLSPDGLWNLRTTLEAGGQDVPEGKMKVNLKELKGMEFGVTTETEMYKKKPRSRVTDVFSLEDMEESEETEEEKETEEEGEEGEEESEGEESTEEEGEEGEEESEEVDLDEMNLKELLAFAEEQEIALTKKQKLSANRARRAIEAALEEEED